MEFAGWNMPIQYTGVIDEYHAVRRQAGLFDVSHMGRFAVVGEGALSFLQRVTTNDVAKLDTGRSQYSMVCNPGGGIKDDVFLYCRGRQDYLLCVNASNRVKILEWLRQQCQADELVNLSDQSSDIAQVALQGPASTAILKEGMEGDWEVIKPRQCLEMKIFGIPIFLSRTGYTGEIGYELYTPATETRTALESANGDRRPSRVKAGRSGCTRPLTAGRGVFSIWERIDRGNDAGGGGERNGWLPFRKKVLLGLPY